MSEGTNQSADITVSLTQEEASLVRAGLNLVVKNCGIENVEATTLAIVVANKVAAKLPAASNND